MGGGEWKEGKERDRDEEKDKRRCERRTRWEKGRRRRREDRWGRGRVARPCTL